MGEGRKVMVVSVIIVLGGGVEGVEFGAVIGGGNYSGLVVVIEWSYGMGEGRGIVR